MSDQSQNEAAMLMLKGVITELSEEDQAQIMEAKQSVIEVLAPFNPHVAMLAISCVGTEVAAERIKIGTVAQKEEE